MKKWIKNKLINIAHSKFFDEDQRDFSHQTHAEYEREEQRKADILISKMSTTQKYMIAVNVLEDQIQMVEDRVKSEATSDNQDGTQLWLDQLFQLIAFKDGVANGLLDGENNALVKEKYCRSSYKQGYDFGLTLYNRYNNLDEEQANK